MSQLHNLVKIKLFTKKRKGRGTGSGKGAKSTRGNKRHQSAKEKIPMFFEGGQNRMTKKFPLLRGKGKNKSINEKPLLIDLSDLQNIDSGKEEVNVKYLVDNGVVDVKALKVGVKVLDTGELTKSVIVKLTTSKNAKLKIEKAGGQVL